MPTTLKPGSSFKTLCCVNSSAFWFYFTEGDINAEIEEFKGASLIFVISMTTAVMHCSCYLQSRTFVFSFSVCYGVCILYIYAD